MPEYKIHKVVTGNTVHLSFEFFPPHEQLSGFLICDSSLMFGKKFERYETVINKEYYCFGGNAYDIELSPEKVIITCTVDIENEESETISRSDFEWVMREWIRENLKLKQAET